ncbi:hypothetical protein [Devosia sp.]|uniref:hypothetical protein n=1 Tax=Devosia sp. TaxID=1871048 RepID=UPI002612C0CA|nr:hypothetical protein [Devosia sp.]
MTLLMETGTTRRMGRPPLKLNTETVVTTIRITADVAARIDALVGPNKRGEFIREAIERELLARATAKARQRQAEARLK